MTVERKIVVSLADVKRITLECNSCHARVSYLPDEKIEIPNICPQCRSEWRRELKPRNEAIDSTTVKFLELFRKLRVLVDDGHHNFAILLEFEEPK